MASAARPLTPAHIFLEMSPSGRLCLLTIVGLILPTRGQTSEEAPSLSPLDSTTVNIHDPVQTPGPVSPEPKSNPETSTQHADETTQNQTETLTQQPTRTDALLTTDPGTSTSRKEGTTMLSMRRSPSKHSSNNPQTPRPPGTDEDNPFLYDIDTLRKRGLLVAAVLFITGIAILTSGKCRQWSRLCRNYCR
ncbi:FXYD domain-containing ion transport regulator 5 [Tupaia chinensis]|uniref:FXYD domain-containing ion transport regulator 5 n=1 Tax=Tupaia chinensis TaxID=246437 RepID=UPI0003C8C92B|nr:FXYD domain-containing ion transport regulator 5 [Tupaia chinensis]